MTSSVLRDRERNPARSREDILDAAERLFAERGYEATSLSDVGREAGLSRAAPGYFFGSKAELLRAVLERCFEEVRAAVRVGRDRAMASGQGADVILAGVVTDYFDFVAARPNFVKLVQREALSDRRTLTGMPVGLATGREMNAALGIELGLGPDDETELTQLLFSLIALVWFPHIHGDTLGRVVGLDPQAPDYLDARKRHVTELLRGWLRARSEVPLLSQPTNR
ncbi:MAG: TetR/AcrR family transcriptional regulator [Gemmatimonadetes bacterium]|nr:TetR/AcrR family transcriptional regulator [Gemmatimonadota bacterium]